MNTIRFLSFLIFALLTLNKLNAQKTSNYSIDIDKLTRLVEAKMSEENIPGVAIGIVVNKQLEYFLPFGLANKSKKLEITPNTGFQIASITKPVLATMAIKLHSEGKIDINAPIKNYLPEVALPESLIPITLTHLFSHSSGLPESAINRRDIPNTPSVPYPYNIKDLYDGLKDTPLLFEPGTFFQYSNIGLKLAGHVLEAAMNQPLEELLKSELLNPLEMTATYIRNKPAGLSEAAHYWSLDGARSEQKKWDLGEVSGSGGITSTISDFAKYLNLQFNRSESTASIVKPDFLKITHFARVPTSRAMNEFVGLGWFSRYDKNYGNTIYHSGNADGHSGYVSLLPEDGIGLIVFANKGGVADEIGEEIEPIVYQEIINLKTTMRDAFNKNDHETLISTSTRLIELNSSNSRAQYFLGRAYYDLGQFEKVEKPMLEALSGKTLVDYAHFYLAGFYAKKGENKTAYWHLTQAVNGGFIDGDRLLNDKNLAIFKGTESYRKLAKWGHDH